MVTVNRSAGSLVRPSQPTPSGNLPLSWIDTNMLTHIKMKLVFKHGLEPAMVIRDALSKALVPYYPLAGRLCGSEVACTNDGVWFVDASVDCTLEDMGSLEEYKDLLPVTPIPVGVMIMMQVTKFKCDGFVVGFGFDHVIADGIGMGQFMNAVAEFARGLNHTTVEPVWCREFIPGKPKAMPSLSPPITSINQNRRFHIDVSLEEINQLKRQFVDQAGYTCSTFEILIGMAWQCRARVINFDPDVEVHLVFAANIRKFLLGGGRGYYGNAVQQMIVKSSSGKIMHGSIVELVDLIVAMKRRIPIEFLDVSKGEEEEEEYFRELAFNYGSFVVSDWTRLGLNEVDYGFGKPAFMGPLLPDTSPVASAILIKSPAPKQGGTRLILQCVEEKNLVEFQNQVVNAFKLLAAPSPELGI